MRRGPPRRLPAVVYAAFLACIAAPPAPAQTPREIVDRVDRMLRGNSSRADIAMEIATAHWTRSLEMRAWSLGTEYALIRVTSPASGTKTSSPTLKAGDLTLFSSLAR